MITRLAEIWININFPLTLQNGLVDQFVDMKRVKPIGRLSD